MPTTRWTAEAHPPSRKPSANVAATALIHHVCRIIWLMVCPPWSEHLLLDERRRLEIGLHAMSDERRDDPHDCRPTRARPSALAAVDESSLGNQLVDPRAARLMPHGELGLEVVTGEPSWPSRPHGILNPTAQELRRADDGLVGDAGNGLATH